MQADPQTCGPTLMRGGLEKSVRKFYVGWAYAERAIATHT